MATPSRTKSGGSGCKPYFDLFCCKIYCSSNQIAERLITTFQLRSHAHTLKRVMEITAIAQTAANELGYRQLKPEQADVIEAFVKGRDVFAVLPTGYGKSLCYGCLPLVFDRLHDGEERSIVVVVSPLIAIMKDQASSVTNVYNKYYMNYTNNNRLRIFP